MEKTKQHKFFGRTASRFYAVQLLYTWDLLGVSPKYSEPPFLSEVNLNPMDYAVICFNADDDLYELLCAQTMENKEKIDEEIEKSLNDSWSIPRINKVVLSILRASTGEMLFQKEVPGAVIINEYINISKTFLETREVSFINAFLDNTSKNIRT
jgi:N utilization substance protein B